MDSETALSEPSFNNTQVDIDTLPKASDVTFKALEPVYIRAASLLWAAFVMVPIIASLVVWFGPFDPPEELRIVVLVATDVAIAVALLNVFELRRRGYAMRDHDILYKKGLVWRSIRVIPFSRVQHVETHRGPIDRLTGLSELKIYTAGGVSSDCNIPGLTISTASTLRQAILNHAYEDGAMLAPQEPQPLKADGDD